MERRFATRLVAMCICTAIAPVSGCWNQDKPTPPPTPQHVDRDADASASDPLGETVEKIEYLDQNWSPEESTRFYFTSQGSQILPYDWFLALEQPNSTNAFRVNANLTKYRYLLQKPGPMNPDGLPVGFVKDNGPERAWLGLTCAACHTGQVEFKGIGYRIDGGPSGADVHGFLRDLSAALVATRDDAAKLDRFASKVLKRVPSTSELEAFKNDLQIVIERRQGYIDRNFPVNALPGHGRVDAFGAILNEVYHRAVRVTATTPSTENTAAANAPVSYPFLWDTPQHDIVQWNGAAENKGLGSLGRNVGEVLGVFGDFDIPDRPTPLGYASTVQVRNLLKLEEWLKSLWSPRWPAAFPAVDAQKAERGRSVYERAGCAECHAPIDRADPSRKIEAIMRAVGTDPQMYENFNTRTGQSGKLQGAFVRVIPWPPINPQRIGPTSTADEILSHTVLGTIIGAWRDAPQDELSQVGFERRSGARAVAPGEPPGGVYKARPLNGIWATAPYLHNGSVPSLYQLLLPPDQRLAEFSVGTREFDPVHVGFQADKPGFPKFRVRGDDGQPIPGNSNAGHSFGEELTDEERWDLVEYLKTL